MTYQKPTLLQKIGALFSLSYLPGGEPAIGQRLSRYGQGFGLSSRLDEDIDALTARIAVLEARLAERD